MAPAFLQEYPTLKIYTFRLIRGVFQAWLTFLKDCPPDAHKDWEQIFHLWQTQQYESYGNKLDLIRTQLVCQLLAFWPEEERRGRATCLKEVFSWIGAQLRQDLLGQIVKEQEHTELEIIDDTLFYQWECSVSEWAGLDLSRSRLKGNLALLHTAVKICHRVDPSPTEMDTFRQSNGPAIFGL